MEGGNWEGVINMDGKGNGGFRVRCGEGQERWLDGHENEWKSAIDGCAEVGGESPEGDRDQE